MSRKKSLLVGINYVGSEHELRGCHKDVDNMAEFLSYRGYPSDPRSQVILRDDGSEGRYFPDGHNMLAAMDWLVCEPGTTCFMHYSGHGGQVPDEDNDRSSGFADTIVPVDFEVNGQIDSNTLHRHLVTSLAPNSTLFLLFDCCHSGSCCELSYTYRTDSEGNISMMDNLKKGMQLAGEANQLLQGGFSFNKLGEARELYAGATDFFRGLTHMEEQQQEGFAQEEFAGEWQGETKFVTMFSGCRDDQTSADANIQGINEGAMTWSFLQTMRQLGPQASYVDVCIAVSMIHWHR
jgi:metacaspase-1